MLEIIQTITINNIKIYQIKSTNRIDWYFVRKGLLWYLKDLKYYRDTRYKFLLSTVLFNTEDWKEYHKIKHIL